MMERGLWGFFDGTEKKPDDESGIVAWKKKDQKAFATLISCIGINLVSSVRMCIKLEASAHEAWKRLETIHVNKTLHGIIWLVSGFYHPTANIEETEAPQDAPVMDRARMTPLLLLVLLPFAAAAPTAAPTGKSPPRSRKSARARSASNSTEDPPRVPAHGEARD
ncbi:unnamed protein product [Closterium sp. NIES-64]|nr:unnamed protein product [Closterium sp. NIES-64]